MEATAANYPNLANPVDVSDFASLRLGDPSLFEAVETVIAALKNDMLPEDVQLKIVETMSPGTRRSVVAKMAGLNASVLMTFKDQIALVDTVLRRIITPDGSLIETGKDLQISVKEAMNMSLKVVGMLTRDLPKVLNTARVQRLEQALMAVVDTLSRDKQDEVLALLEKEELKAAREGGF